ncbi:glycosyl hydrolase family 8, partial [Klebsiella pneumoniae]|uniref:glycosyl hydrolase family 8 n=1 Tax=Klebsiella pneumoniae TaxID=573 RepID=UPI00286FB707
MMKVLCGAVLSALLRAGGRGGPPCQWPAWEQFKQAYVSPEGRVIDPSDARKISTSEGQS